MAKGSDDPHRRGPHPHHSLPRGTGEEGPLSLPRSAGEDWFPDWSRQTAVVLASGPSANAVRLDVLSQARVIAVNDSWRLWPAAEVLYACDRAWWNQCAGAPGFTGLKVTQDARAARLWGLHQVAVAVGRHEILTQTAGVVGDGRNSGFQALNLAVQFGARRILLVGFDMHLDGGGHWHGPHPAPLNNTRPEVMAIFRQRLDAVAPQLAALGVEVLNATPGSALTAYRPVDLAEALTITKAA